MGAGGIQERNYQLYAGWRGVSRRMLEKVSRLRYNRPPTRKCAPSTGWGHPDVGLTGLLLAEVASAGVTRRGHEFVDAQLLRERALEHPVVLHAVMTVHPGRRLVAATREHVIREGEHTLDRV